MSGSRHTNSDGSSTSLAAVSIHVARVDHAGQVAHPDLLAAEEPLEIRVGHAGRVGHTPISVTMRTPGNDRELAAGYLFTEGIVADRGQIVHIHTCQTGRAVRVTLQGDVTVNRKLVERNSFTTSSCGACGKMSLDALRVPLANPLNPGRPICQPTTIHSLPERLRSEQAVFDRTGGLHAAALFTPDGSLLSVREDVGRHNAVDKLIGAEFLAGRVPLINHILLVSGRVSFELVQKAAVAGIPILAAVGAPSSLAVRFARELGMTVLGFIRYGRFNLYSGADRLCVEG